VPLAEERNVYGGVNLRSARVAGFAVLQGYFIVPNIVPSIRAAQGDGVPGWFEATWLGDKRCLWHGDFRPDTDGAARHNVWIEGAGCDDLRPGARTRAMETGANSNVYTPDGDVHWTGMIFGSLSMSALAVGGCRIVWMARPRRARKASTF
jgi:hypothetical protein